MTSVNDPIGDLLTRVRNAQRARRAECRAPWSRIKQQICELLKGEGWIAGVQVGGESPKQELVVTFAKDRPPLTLARVSTPGRRMYRHATELKSVLQGYGMAVVTTSEGIMTDKEARKRKLGGEVLCTVS